MQKFFCIRKEYFLLDIWRGIFNCQLQMTDFLHFAWLLISLKSPLMSSHFHKDSCIPPQLEYSVRIHEMASAGGLHKADGHDHNVGKTLRSSGKALWHRA